MKPLPSQRIVWSLRALCAAALTISGYLTWVAFNKSEVAGCGGQVFDCDHVLSSRWSNWFSVPVALGAVGLYVSALIALTFCSARASERQQRFGWRSFSVLGASAGLAALWFISLQVFLIGHLCSWCLTAHACGLLIAAIVLWQRPLGFATTMRLSSLSVAAVSVLIGGQVLTPPPPTYQVEYHDEEIEMSSSGSPDETEEGVFEAPPFDDDDDVFEPPVFDDEDNEETAEVAKLEEL